MIRKAFVLTLIGFGIAACSDDETAYTAPDTGADSGVETWPWQPPAETGTNLDAPEVRDGVPAADADDATTADVGASPDGADAASDSTSLVEGGETAAADADASMQADVAAVTDGPAPLAPPTDVWVVAGAEKGSVIVHFTAPVGGVGLSYLVTATPGDLKASGTSSPITLSGLAPKTSYVFSVVSVGTTSSAPASTHTLGFYDVVETFREPMTQPNDTIFTGTFTFDEHDRTVSQLAGTLTQSMTKVGGVFGGPMTMVSLTHQLSAAGAPLGGADGLLVTTFALATTDTFTGGGFAPGGTQYFGLQEGVPNNHNAYAMIFVNVANPEAPLAQAQLEKLAYADCTAGGMMRTSCMTGTSEAGYGRKGTMMGVPFSQLTTKR